MSVSKKNSPASNASTNSASGFNLVLGPLNVPFNKNTWVSIFLVAIILLIARKLLPPSVDNVFTLIVSKNKTSITNIHQERDVELYREIKIDRIDLADQNRFRHPVLGDLGYAEDFFADVASSFMVKVSGDYLFYVASDDGFSLSIDGKTLCEWVKDRPLTTDVCTLHLDSGVHQFSLNYFQGFGNAGLSMHYAHANDGKQYFMGENSKFMTFN